MKTQLQAAAAEIFLLLAFVAMLSTSDGTQSESSRVDALSAPVARLEPDAPPSTTVPDADSEADGLQRQVLARTSGGWVLDGHPVRRDELAGHLHSGTNTVRIQGLLAEESRALLRELADHGVAIELE